MSIFARVLIHGYTRAILKLHQEDEWHPPLDNVKPLKIFHVYHIVERVEAENLPVYFDDLMRDWEHGYPGPNRLYMNLNLMDKDEDILYSIKSVDEDLSLTVPEFISRINGDMQSVIIRQDLFKIFSSETLENFCQRLTKTKPGEDFLDYIPSPTTKIQAPAIDDEFWSRDNLMKLEKEILVDAIIGMIKIIKPKE